MVSFYYLVNFRDLRMKEHSNPKGSHCELCRYNNNKLCGECVFGTGNSKLKDYYMPIKKVLVERGVIIKKADYYDKTISDLLLWNGELKKDVEDIKRYRQW